MYMYIRMYAYNIRYVTSGMHQTSVLTKPLMTVFIHTPWPTKMHEDDANGIKRRLTTRKKGESPQTMKLEHRRTSALIKIFARIPDSCMPLATHTCMRKIAYVNIRIYTVFYVCVCVFKIHVSNYIGNPS